MWRDDDRGQSIQIGAVLLFGALVVALAGYQAFVVPQQNEQVEFSHSQTVQDQLTDLRNALVSVPGDSSVRSISVQLGTRYPDRLIAVNPSPPTGSLRTRGTADPAVAFSVANATADGETGDFWNGSEREYTTGWIRYSPNYNVYGAAPTTYYGSSVLFNEFPSGAVALTGQALVDGDRISLVALNGSLGVTQVGTASVDVRPVSASTRTVAIANEAGERVTLRVPTRLSESTWEELLADEMVAAGGHVEAVSTEPLAGYPDARLLVVELERDVTYTLQLAKAGVGSGVTGTSEAYLTQVSGNGSQVPEGGTATLVVEVRDAYNNPVSGVTVAAAADGTGSVTPASATTDGDGQVVLTYEAPANIDGDPQTVDVDASIETDPGSVSTFDQSTPENVTFTLEVTNTDGSGTGSAGGDTTGPAAKKASVNRTSVEQGKKFNLTAVVNDIGRGGTDILEAEFWSNRTTPGGSAGSGFAMSAEDGQFDMANESVINASIDTDGWTIGVHNLSVRGRDANGTWGNESHVTIEITSAPSGNDGANSGDTGSASDVTAADAEVEGGGEEVTATVDVSGTVTVTDVSIDTTTLDSNDNSVRTLETLVVDKQPGPPSDDVSGTYQSDGTLTALDSNEDISGTDVQFLFKTFDPAVDDTSVTLQETEPSSGDYITIRIKFDDGTTDYFYIDFG